MTPFHFYFLTVFCGFLCETPGSLERVKKKDEVLTFPMSAFQPGFCVTTHKYQGLTIVEDYNIYDLNAMSYECLITALGRAKKLSQIHLEYTGKIFQKTTETDEVFNIPVKPVMKAYIYKLTNEENKVCYIGKTERTIEERLKEHIEENALIKKYNGEWKAERLEEVLYTKKKTLLRREAEHIENYKGEYKLINKQHNKKEELVVVKEKKNIISVGKVDVSENKMFKIVEDDGKFRIGYQKKWIATMRFNNENKEQVRQEMMKKRGEIISEYAGVSKVVESVVEYPQPSQEQQQYWEQFRNRSEKTETKNKCYRCNHEIDVIPKGMFECHNCKCMKEKRDILSVIRRGRIGKISLQLEPGAAIYFGINRV